jgi:hypothetical protein
LNTSRSPGARSRTKRRRSRAPASAPATRGWFTWRNVSPVLLKSGGVVGLAGVIVSLISTTFWIVDPNDSRGESQHPGSQQIVTAAAKPAAKAVRSATPLDPTKLSLVTFKQQNPTAAASPEPVVKPPEPASVVAPQSAPATVPSAQSQEATAPTAWKSAAVECPRDWLNPDGANSSPGTGVDCAPMIALSPTGNVSTTLPGVVAATAPDAPPSDPPSAPAPAAVDAPQPDAPSVLDAPSAPVARVPEARPATTPTKVALASPPRSAAAAPRRAALAPRRLSAPPNCGKRHAFWRYVDKRRTQKTWYCK